MSASEDDARVRALRGFDMSLVTLPRRAKCADVLADAVTAFTENTANPAAVASATWLRKRAFAEHDSARTYMWVADGRVHGFFAISTGIVQLDPRERAPMEVGPYPLPAALLAQAARCPDGKLPPNAILQGALGVAEELTGRIALAALMLDPYDEPTGAMWRARGFRPTSNKPHKGRQQRLWRPLTS